MISNEEKSLFEKGSELIELKKELFELNLKEKSSRVGSKISLFVVSGMLIILSSAFLGIALAVLLNELLLSNIWGFVIVSVAYILLAFVLLKSESRIRNFVSFQLLKMLDEEEKSDF